jgi:hypothetical protein
MNKGVRVKNLFLIGIVSCLIIYSSPQLPAAQDIASKGNIIGFIYAKDGTTALEGAVVKFKSLSSGTVYESTPSDANGIFKVQKVETGIYTYGVVTETGDFNADNLVGLRIAENETAKLSIAVNPYDKEVATAVSEVIKDQEASGESLVGTISEFNPNTRMAQVQVVKGLLRVNDKIHTKGKSTNFYQDIDVLMIGNNSTGRILSGQTGSVKLDQTAQTGDLVFVVRSKSVFPFFMAPLGVATVIAANTAVTYHVLRIRDEGEPVSAFKNK